MQVKRFIITGVAGLCLSGGLMACQDRIVIDREAPFGSKVVRLGDVEVAAVDGTAIYLSDVEQLARTKGEIADTQSIDPNSPLFKTTLRELIDQRVLGLAAITQSLDETETAKRRRALALEQLYGRFVIEEALRENVTDEVVQRLFEEQQALNNRGPERRARMILVETQEEADAVLERLDAGEDFGVLAGILSIDKPSANNNGDLGYFSRDMLGQDIAKMAFAAPLKSLTPIFETPAGFHILEVLSQRTPPARSFEEMEAELREFLTYSTINKTINMLRERSDIRLNVAAPLDRPPEIEAAPDQSSDDRPDDIENNSAPTAPDTETK